MWVSNVENSHTVFYLMSGKTSISDKDEINKKVRDSRYGTKFAYA